jgi:hypothetical protein
MIARPFSQSVVDPWTRPVHAVRSAHTRTSVEAAYAIASLVQPRRLAATFQLAGTCVRRSRPSTYPDSAASVVIVELIPLRDIPGSCWQQTSTTRAPDRLDRLLRVPNRLPLCVESATFLSLPAKFGLESLDSPSRPEQHPNAQTGQQDQACRLDGHRALRWIPPRRFVS